MYQRQTFHPFRASTWHALGWLFACAVFPSQAAADASAMAPDWTLTTSAGTLINFHTDARDAPAVMFFWASWCPHCRTALPIMEALYQEFTGRGVRFYALDVWEDGDAVAYFRDHHCRLPLLLAADLVAEEYAIDGTPAIVVSDRHRRVYKLAIDGARPAEIGTRLRSYLNEQLGGVAATAHNGQHTY